MMPITTHRYLHGIFFGFSTGICTNYHFCQICVAGIVAMAPVAQKTMGIRGLLPPMLWLNSCSSFEEIVAKSSCAAKNLAGNSPPANPEVLRCKSLV